MSTDLLTPNQRRTLPAREALARLVETEDPQIRKARYRALGKASARSRAARMLTWGEVDIIRRLARQGRTIPSREDIDALRAIVVRIDTATATNPND